jgi:hypothetical protein
MMWPVVDRGVKDGANFGIEPDLRVELLDKRTDLSFRDVRHQDVSPGYCPICAENALTGSAHVPRT